MKMNVYIDGFNLYYGCLKDSPYRWLDVSTLAQNLLPHDTINRIRYFTARVRPRPHNPGQGMRQQIYLRALATLPNLTIHYGHYLSHPVRMPFEPPPASGPRMAQVMKTEEKGSDVNLASFLLVDAFEKDYEGAVILSNDSDLALPIELVRSKFGLVVGVLNPHPKPSMALARIASFTRPIRAHTLAAAQFPPILTDQHGTITKPVGW